jgi:gamma-glutamylcyclotransferase (GGCT)/AIG2-like uncharacterized protein YtfP
MQSEYLFVYGTLRPEYAPEEVADVVRELAIVGEGTIQGVLYDLGSFPGVVLDAHTTRRVSGTVFRLPETGNLLSRLDEYEEYFSDAPDRSQFIRRLRSVELADSRAVECWVYEFNGETGAAVVIENGVYSRQCG